MELLNRSKCLLTEENFNLHKGLRFNVMIIVIPLARLAIRRMTDEAWRRLTGTNQWSGPISHSLIKSH